MKNLFSSVIFLLLVAIHASGYFVAPQNREEAFSDDNQRPELVLQTGHSSIVEAVVFSSDGRWTASGSFDNTIKIWDLETERELRTLTGHTGPVMALAWSPDCKWLASGGNDKTVRIWDVESGNAIKNYDGQEGAVETVAFSRDGKKLASGGSGKTIIIRDIATGQELSLRGHADSISALTFSPDGRLLASGSADRTVRVWDAISGKQLRKFDEHKEKIRVLRFDDAGVILASGSDDKTVRLWKATTGGKAVTLPRHSDNILAVNFISPGKLMSADAGGTIKTWDTTTKLEILSVNGVRNKDLVGQPETPANFSADGAFLAMGNGDGTTTVYETKTGQPQKTLENQTNGLNGVAFSPDRRWLASAGVDNTIKLWDLKNGQPLPPLKGHTASITCVVFPDNEHLISASLDGTIRIWDILSANPPVILKGHDDRVSSLAAGRKGKLLVSGSSDKTVGIWNLETKEKRFFTEHKGEVTSVAISPDEQFVASASLDQTIKIWDIRTRGVIQNIPVKSGVANAVAFSPDGKLLASGGVDKLVSIWDVQTGNLVQTFPPGHTRIISSVSFSPDGKQVASSSYDKTIRIWNVSDGKEIRPLTGHAGTVHSASYSTDGQFLSTASEDGTIIIWKSDTGDRLATLISIKDSNDWLVVTPEGFFDGSPSAREKLSWRFEKNTFNVRPIEVFFNEFYLPGVLATILGNGKLPSNSNISNRDRRQPEVNLKLVTNGSDPVVTAGRVTARIYVSQAVAGAKDIRLFRNGALVKVWHDDQLLTGQTSAMVETNIPVVAGLNHLTAYAFNKDDVKSKNSSVDVTGPASLARKGVSYIFAVGINEYANPVFDLDYAVPDAEDFAGEFDRQQTKLGNYDHTEVKILKNKDATKKNILDALAELSAKIKPEDALIIYFAGHGAAKGKRFYLIPHDLGYDGDKPRSDSVEFRTILSHSISDEDLETAVEGIDAGHLLMIIDACNSGQALESDEKRQGPMNTKGLAQRADEKGMYILAAAQGDQKALETTKLGHGLLTFALVDEGLKTDKADLEPKDGKVLMREWLDYATNRVPLLEQDQSKARQLERETMKETKPGKGVDFQRPKVFYPGGTDSNQLVVARPKPLN